MLSDTDAMEIFAEYEGCQGLVYEYVKGLCECERPADGQSGGNQMSALGLSAVNRESRRGNENRQEPQ
ncbi:MAG TPA: hypothetical protein GXX59_03455 [Syntrophomonadaceae bacterium]|nr:hypothetical protein [Syntrophomonadaceae bacterium]